MAEATISVEKKFIKHKHHNLGKTIQSGLEGVFSQFGGMDKINEAIKKIKAALPEDSPLKGMKIFENNVLENMSKKELSQLLEMLSGINSLAKMEMPTDKLKAEVADAVKFCQELLEKTGDKLYELASVKDFSNANLQKVLEGIESGDMSFVDDPTHSEYVLIPSQNDLDVAIALERIGYPVRFDGNSWVQTKGTSSSSLPTNNGKQFKLEEKYIAPIIKYLNSKESERTFIVDPSKIVEVFVQEYQAEVMQGIKKGSLEESRILKDVAEVRARFSMDSEQTQIARLLDTETIMHKAQTMAIVRLFEDGAGIEGIDELSDDIQTSLDNLDSSSIIKDSKSKLASRMQKLVPMVDHAGNRYENATDFEVGGIEDFAKAYDLQIASFTRKEGEAGPTVLALQKAKKQLEEAAAVQYAFIKTAMDSPRREGSPLQRLPEVMTRAMGIHVNENGGFDMAMKGNKSQSVVDFLTSMYYRDGQGGERDKAASTFEQLRQRALSKGAMAAGPAQKEQLSKYPDIFSDVMEMLDADKSGMSMVELMEFCSNVQLYQYMWKENGILDKMFKELKTKNPNATVADLIQDFEAEAIFDPEAVQDAYYLTHPEEVKDKAQQERVEKANKKIETFQEYFLLVDLMAGSFTLDDVTKLGEKQGSEKTAFLNLKYQEARKTFELLKGDKNPKKYEEALQLARKRHEAGVVGSVIKAQWNDILGDVRTAEGDRPIISDAVEAFINAKKQQQKKNNAELQASGQSVVDTTNTPENPENDAQPDKKKKNPTYNDFFPSEPDDYKFLKDIKRRNRKAVLKSINMMKERIKKFEINEEEYQRKINLANGDMFTPEAPKEKTAAEKAKEAQDNAVRIMQSDFEASLFMPAQSIFAGLATSNPSSPNVQSYSDLSRTFELLTKTERSYGFVGKSTPDGKNVSSELRHVALDILAGKFGPQSGSEADVKASGKVAFEVKEILAKYQVDPVLSDQVLRGFRMMTPEFLVMALSPVSKLEGSKIEVGAGLKNETISSIVAAQNDRDRYNAVIDSIESSKLEYAAGEMQTWVDLVREMEGKTLEDSLADSFRDEKNPTSATYHNVSGEAKKQFEELEKLRKAAEAAAAAKAASTSAPVNEDEGMGGM